MKHPLHRAYAAQRAMSWRKFIRLAIDRNAEDTVLAALYFFLLALLPVIAWIRG